MPPAIFEIVVEPLLYAALVACVFLPLERVFALREARRTEARVDVAFATLGAIVTQGLIYGLFGLTLAAVAALDVEGPLVEMPAPIAILVALLVFETMGYVYHRLAHSIPLLWRFHEVHHSSTHLDWLAGFRQHPIEIAAMTLVQNLPLVLLGLPLGSHAVVVLSLRLNTLYVHSNLRTPPWLSLLFATPAFHHRHHDRDGASRNYASLFPWIDRAFGTFVAEPAREFGLPRARSQTFFGLLTSPFRARAQ